MADQASTDKDQIERFLANIGQIESSGGKDFSHKTITKGLQKGDTAIGTYGLMPNTVDEVVSNSSNDALKPLLDMSNQEKKQFLERNPAMEHDVARELAQKVLDKQGGNEEKAAYTWLYGHNMSPERVDRRGYESDPYVQKYRQADSTHEKPPMTQVLGSLGPQTVPAPMQLQGPLADKAIASYEPNDMSSKTLMADQDASTTNALKNLNLSKAPSFDTTPDEQDEPTVPVSPVIKPPAVPTVKPSLNINPAKPMNISDVLDNILKRGK